LDIVHSTLDISPMSRAFINEDSPGPELFRDSSRGSALSRCVLKDDRPTAVH